MDVLKKSLAKNGLPVTGTKAEMLGRLLSGTTDKRKSPKKAAADAPNDSDVETSEEYVQFALAERQNLEASGITSDEDIEEEITRRWKVLQSLKPLPKAEDKSQSADVKILPILLDDKQLAALEYIYIGPTKGGEHMYGVKKPAPTPASSSSKPDASPVKKSSSKAVSGTKRKADQVVKPEPEAVETKKSDDEPDMEWACKISLMRLLKKVKRENMISLCKDFGIPSKGSSEQIAESLSVQLHYETDEED